MANLSQLEKVAIDDELYIEYFRFKHGKSQRQNLVDKLFSHLKMPFVQAPCQYLRCEPNLPDAAKLSTAMKTQLLATGSPDKTEQQLAEASLYQLILTNDKHKMLFPYLNINQPGVELNYSKTCSPNESRAQLLTHLTALCTDAHKVVICDDYLFGEWSQAISTEKLFDDILPKKTLNIEFVTGHKKAKKRAIGKKYKDWSITAYSGTLYSKDSNHDRYLLIEKPHVTIEAMLSSGFLYLWKTTKEITCVFRER